MEVTNNRTVNKKSKERGYLIVYLYYGFVVLTTIFALYLQWQTAQRAYEIAMKNVEIVEMSAGNYYVTLVTYAVEFSALSIVIAMEQFVLGKIVGHQLQKKAVNNIFEYMEEFAENGLDDEAKRPYVAQMFNTFMQMSSSYLGNNTQS